MTFTTFYLRNLTEKDGIIVDFVVMPNEAKFGNIFLCELENDSIIEINAKTPDIVSFGVELFSAQNWVKWILLEQLGLLGRLALNLLIKRLEKFIECFGGDNLHYSPMSSKRLFLLVIRPAW